VKRSMRHGSIYEMPSGSRCAQIGGVAVA
jgi:hypothetical protein